MKELQSEGLPIVPTIFLDYNNNNTNTNGNELELQKIQNWNGIIIKPGIGCDSENIAKFDSLNENALKHIDHIISIKRNVLIQPYLNSIKTHGEISLIYINKIFSHCILKSVSTSTDDYRIQEKYGGSQKAIPVTQEMLDLGKLTIEKLEKIFSNHATSDTNDTNATSGTGTGTGTIDNNLLYMRIDILLCDENCSKQHDLPLNSYLIGEIELVEPALYFHEDSLFNSNSMGPDQLAIAISNML